MTRDAPTAGQGNGSIDSDRQTRAMIFDMDGVLIDSEPFWRRAEIKCFGEVGLTLTEEDCFKTVGLRIDEVANYWFERSPWPEVAPSVIADRIVEEMAALISAEGVPAPGAQAAIEAVQGEGWRIALASSSSMRLIETVLKSFGWHSHFEVVRSAENESHGKPHPAVYLATVRALGLESADCVAIEDSANGMISALEAGMRCIAIPEAATRHDPRFESATWRFDSLTDLPATLPAIRCERQERNRS